MSSDTRQKKPGWNLTGISRWLFEWIIACDADTAMLSHAAIESSWPTRVIKCLLGVYNQLFSVKACEILGRKKSNMTWSYPSVDVSVPYIKKRVKTRKEMSLLLVVDSSKQNVWFLELCIFRQTCLIKKKLLKPSC